MAFKLQIHEIFDMVQKAPSDKAAIDILYKHHNATIAMVLFHAYSPTIKYKLPEGTPPFKTVNIPAGYAEATFYSEERRLRYLWINPPAGMKPVKLEALFIQLLEGMHQDDAKILIAMKDKTLDKLYPRLTEDFIRTAYPVLLPHKVVVESTETTDNTEVNKTKSKKTKTSTAKTPAKKKKVVEKAPENGISQVPQQ